MAENEGLGASGQDPDVSETSGVSRAASWRTFPRRRPKTSIALGFIAALFIIGATTTEPEPETVNMQDTSAQRPTTTTTAPSEAINPLVVVTTEAPATTAPPTTTPTTAAPATAPASTKAPVKAPATTRAPATTAKPKSTSGDGYINVDGNHVQSPTHAESPPAGASAKCKDGTYSFSQHRQGTCSGHGGVASWL